MKLPKTKILKIYTLFYKPAKEILSSDKSLKEILKEAKKKFANLRSQSKHRLRDLKDLFDLLAAWGKGDYKKVPWKSLVAAAAGILYFLNPFDFVPDMLGVLGFADDALVLSWVIKSIQADLTHFLDWKKERKSTVHLKKSEYEHLN